MTTTPPNLTLQHRLGHKVIVAGVCALVVMILLIGVGLNSLFHSDDSAQIASLQKQVGDLTSQRDELKGMYTKAQAEADKVPVLKDRLLMSEGELSKANAKIAELSKTAESKVAKTEAPAPKPEEVTPPAPKPEEKDVALEGDDTSRLTIARQISVEKCHIDPVSFSEETRSKIIAAKSRAEIYKLIDCGDGSKEQEKVAEAPAPVTPLPAKTGGPAGCADDPHRMWIGGSCIYVFNRRH